MLNLLVSVSQWEREAIAERTAFVLQHKRLKREVYGHPPFGFRREDARLIEVPEELQALRVTERMRENGRSLRQIAEWLSANGFVLRQNGKKW